MIDTLVDIISGPLLLPTDPSRRVFWLFLISAVIMASIAVTLSQKRFDLRYQLSNFFSIRYWFHRSNLTDCILLFVNSTAKILFLLPLLGSYFLGAMTFGIFLQSHLGDPPDFSVSILVVGISYTLVFFIIEDLSRFSLHCCMHKCHWLWYFHKTHHSATNLTPLTVYRVHPVEMTLYYLRGFLVFSLVSGVFIYLFRGKLNGIDILGVDCLGFLFSLLGANLRHSPIWLSFGKLERYFISPAQHQLHHSNSEEHRDINFGTCFSLWDKLFGSWVPAKKYKKLSYGLTE